jgi:hypothetical protein
MNDYPTGEGPITEEEAKALVAADDAAIDDDVEPPLEPREDPLEIPADESEGDDQV